MKLQQETGQENMLVRFCFNYVVNWLTFLSLFLSMRNPCMCVKIVFALKRVGCCIRKTN